MLRVSRTEQVFKMQCCTWILFIILSVPLLHETSGGTNVLGKKEIHLAGIFPINGVEGWQGGQACEPAARLALADVNNKEDLLPGYHLNLHWNDSGCDAGRGAAVMYDLLYNEPQKVILLAGCSTVCTTVAEAARMWNLVTVCYGASSPALSNRQRFPTLFRTHPSATVHNPTRIRVFQKFGWSKIAILQEAEEVFSTTLDDLEARTKLAGIDISTRQSFLRDPKAAVANLKRQDARIIVGLFYAKAARKVLCEAYKQGLYGPKYVWFFIGWYEDDWFQKHLDDENINCTVAQMEEAAEAHFTTEALQWNQDKSPTISGKTVDDFDLQMRSLLIKKYAGVAQDIMPEGYLEAPLAYDAIWAIALALNRTMTKLSAVGKTLEDYNYENEMIADIILNEIADVQFMGMSGSVAFSEETGDRIAWTKIEQLQNKKYEVVAFYDQKSDNLTWLPPPMPSASAVLDSKPPIETDRKDKVIWIGPKIPQDRTIVKDKLMKLNIWLYLSMVSLSMIGIIFAALLIYFNFRYSHRRIIQYSHPSCNNLILAGIMLCLLATIPIGLDGRFVSPSIFPMACGTGTWLLCLGFTLAYGAMFSKIWRVHRLATKNKADTLKSKVVPWKLWVTLCCLLAVDLVLLIIWTIVDPLQRDVKNFPKLKSNNPEDDVEIQPQLEHCKSEHHYVWLGIMYGYKGLQLVLGLFLAYETRSVKIRQINDSRLVGMAIYNVVVLCMITAPVMLVIGDQQNAAFCFVSLANLFCCFLSMALIFVPKILFIRQHAHDPREKEDDERETAEQEQRYKDILRENESLQKKIAEKEQKLILLRKRLTEKKAEAEVKQPQQQQPQVNAPKGFLATALISAPASGAGTAVMMAATVAATGNSTGHAGSGNVGGGATLEIVPRPTITAAAPVVAACNQHNNIDSIGDGLHSRSNSARGRSGAGTGVGGGSCLSDLERMSSMKGITVLRGRMPNASGAAGVVSLSASSRTFTDQFGEEHVESYL